VYPETRNKKKKKKKNNRWSKPLRNTQWFTRIEQAKKNKTKNQTKHFYKNGISDLTNEENKQCKKQGTKPKA